MKRHRKWAPTTLPDARRTMLVDLRGRSDRARSEMSVLRDRLGELSETEAMFEAMTPSLNAHVPTRGRPSAFGLTDEQRLEQHDRTVQFMDDWLARFERAEMYWINPDMTATALDASHDIPTTTWSQILPTGEGIIGLGRALPPLPADIGGGARPTMLFWRRVAEDLADNPRERWRFHLLAHDPTRPTHLTHLYETATDNEVEFATHPDAAAMPVLAFIAAAVTMMVEPTLVSRRTIDSRTGEPSAARTPLPVGVRVTCVTLRPMREVTTAPDERTESGREYTHRWVVRGHWRQQAHGRDRALRRTTWIGPYVKGPARAPLLAAERVFVWRR